MNTPLAGIQVNLTTPDSETTPSSLSSMSGNSKTSARLKKRVIHEGVLKTFMPAWLDLVKTLDTLSKHPHRNSTQFAQDKFSEKVEKMYREQRHKVAFKEVQRILKSNCSSPSNPKKMETPKLREKDEGCHCNYTSVAAKAECRPQKRNIK